MEKESRLKKEKRSQNVKMVEYVSALGDVV